jgi:tetratricopeptide (TPR) repeat protein
MVMTNRAQRPFLNGSGLAVASLLAALAWMTTPAWSKPPTADEKLKQEIKARASATRVEPGRVETGSHLTNLMRNRAELLGGVISASDEPSSKEAVIAKRRRLSEDDVEARIARLERMIEELAAQRATPPATPARPGMPRPPMQRGAPDDEGRVEMTYRLSGGKLDALVSLMSRNDVPVLIERRDDTIVVHATPAQQEAFRAFVELIEPETAGAAVPRTPRTPRARGFGVAAPRVAPAPPVAPKLRRTLRGAHRAELHRAIEQMHQERDRIEERVESLHDKAEAMREAAERLKDRPREDALREVRVIEQTAEELSRHLEQLDQQAVEMDSALEEVDAAEDMDDEDATPEPDDDARTRHDARTEALFAARRWKEAAEAYRDALHNDADNGEAWYQFGYSLHMQAKYDEAIAAFQRSAELNARPSDSLYNIACGYSLKGDVERALEWLDKAHEAGFEDLDHIRSDADLKTLRQDPRFEKLMSKWSE